MKAGVLTVLAFPVVMTMLLVLFIVVIAAPATASCGAEAGDGDAGPIDISTVPDGPVAGYGHEQLVNAAHIANAAAVMGLPVQAQRIGIMTAMGESSLTILDHGDAAGPDSRGLFQQRGNGAWGSLEDRMDPTISSTNFFAALQRVNGWEQLEPTIAAHKVQGNADPRHYAPFFPLAKTVLTTLTGTTTNIAEAAGDGGASDAGDAAAGDTGGSCSTGEVALPLDRPFIITSHFGKRPTPTPGASSNHPATDMVGRCGDAVYAVTGGTVTKSDRLWLSVQAPAGYTVSYLHMHRSDRLVDVGDTITAGQEIGAVGNEAPSTGCHLDLRINTADNTDPTVAGLPVDASLPGWVDPEDYMAAFGEPLIVDGTR